MEKLWRTLWIMPLFRRELLGLAIGEILELCLEELRHIFMEGVHGLFLKEIRGLLLAETQGIYIGKVLWLLLREILELLIEEINTNPSIRLLIIECSFPNRLDQLAFDSKHLTPKLLSSKIEKVHCSILLVFIMAFSFFLGVIFVI